MNIGSIHHKKGRRWMSEGETYFAGGRLFLFYANTWSFSQSKSEGWKEQENVRNLFIYNFYACKRQWNHRNLIIYVSTMIRSTFYEKGNFWIILRTRKIYGSKFAPLHCTSIVTMISYVKGDQERRQVNRLSKQEIMLSCKNKWRRH